MWLEPKQPGWVREHRPWIGPREPTPFQQLQKHLGVPTAQVRIGPAFWRHVTEVTPAFDDLLRRAATDPELEPAIADHVGRARILDHIERILVAHVDDRRSDLDAARPGADGRKQREGRRELLGKV